MKTIITLLFILPLILTAQEIKPTKQIKQLKKVEKSVKVEKIQLKTQHNVNPLPVMVEPKYVGGREALDIFVNSNFKMSRKDRKKGTQGEIMVKFTVDADGLIKDAKILNGGMSEKLNKEALRVITELPKWTPATKNGKAVDALYAYEIQVGK